MHPTRYLVECGDLRIAAVVIDAGDGAYYAQAGRYCTPICGSSDAALRTLVYELTDRLPTWSALHVQPFIEAGG